MDINKSNKEENEVMAKIITIAKVCHQANKAWCEGNGDFSQVDWEHAPDWQIKAAETGVKFVLDNKGDIPHSAMHEDWMRCKVEDGWVFGKMKDAEAKTHPCIIPFEDLPLFQKQKDALFIEIVRTLM